MHKKCQSLFSIFGVSNDASENLLYIIPKGFCPDIHGEHYRVTAAQWNYLSKQFSIQGVPTYIIVDKEGGIIQKYTGFPGVDTVKKELIKALEK